MGKNVLCLALLAVALFVSGCGSGGFKDDGVPQSFKNQAADANSMAKSVDGNYDKLTPQQQSTFLQMAGSEKGARRLVMMMAHPPNEAMKASHGPPSGPPANPGQ